MAVGALRFTGAGGPGDFLLVPPYLRYQELNAPAMEELHSVLVRGGMEEVVINLKETDAVD
jgi:uncharacterized RmlC-like cupin family protein